MSPASPDMTSTARLGPSMPLTMPATMNLVEAANTREGELMLSIFKR